MPVLKSSKKALKQARKRKAENDITRQRLHKAIKALNAKPTLANLEIVYSTVDRAAKKHVLSKNKAAHIKSSSAYKISK